MPKCREKNFSPPSPRRRGQPVGVLPDPQWSDILYVAICADGSVLPGVVFTSDESLAVRHYYHITVLRVENANGPGANTTQRWLDTSIEYLQDSPVVLLDNLGGHHNHDFTEQLELLGCSTLFFPNQGGKYLNPCDNSVNSIIRRVYAAQQRRTHEEMLDAIDTAYGSISDETIVNSFRHCGLTSQAPARHVIDKLMAQGFQSHGLHREEIQSRMLAYRRWKRNLRSPSTAAPNVHAIPHDSDSLCDELNGRYWAALEQ